MESSMKTSIIVHFFVKVKSKENKLILREDNFGAYTIWILYDIKLYNMWSLIHFLPGSTSLLYIFNSQDDPIILLIGTQCYILLLRFWGNSHQMLNITKSSW